MKNNGICSERSRREFIKRLSAAAFSSTLVVIDSPSLSARESSSGDQGNPLEIEARPTLNCAETVLSRVNDSYQLDFTPENMTFAATFGGGMGIEDKCGAVTGSLMILGYLFRPPTGRDAPAREISVEFLKNFKTRMDSLDCGELKPVHRTEAEGCEYIISTALEVLDSTIRQHEVKRIR